MFRPMTASTSTSASTTDSPPPQSPITPPLYGHQLPPFFGDVQIVGIDTRMGRLSPSSSSSSPTLCRGSFLSSSNKHDSLSPRLDSDNLPTPPSGHDLMHLFPPRPPHAVGLTRAIRHEPSNHSHNPERKANYTNTSAYFSKEEREYFRFGGSVTGRDIESRLEKEREKGPRNERGNVLTRDTFEPERNRQLGHTHLKTPVEPPTKRRKSVDSGKKDCDSRQMTFSPPPPPLALGNVHQRVYPTTSQQQSSQLTPFYSTNNTSSSSIQAQLRPETCQVQPIQTSSGNAGTRRRAGKYTKRVFVQSNPLPNVNPPYILANVYPPSPNDMNPTINVYPLANPLPQKISLPYPPNPPPTTLPQPSQFIEFAR